MFFEVKEKLIENYLNKIYNILATSQSRYGRQILQDNLSSSSSSSSSSSISSQPTFIALICIVAILIIAIIITITILCYRHYSYRKHSKKRHKICNKFRRNSTDHAHLASSITPSSNSSYSIRSSQHLFPNYHPPYQTETPQQTSSLGQSTSTVPSMIPSRRLQQSMMDAYLNDFNSFQPNIIDPKQLNSYLFIDLHSTSSETFPDNNTKKYPHDNTTTSGYDTSTGNEDKTHKNSLRYRRRRRYYHHQQRQRRRSTLALKRSNGARFLMREKSLPSTLVKLPQLRRQQKHHLFDIRDNNSSSTTSNNNQDLISTLTTDDYDESHAYHVNQSRMMDTIEEEKPLNMHQPYFFEMVSTYRGDDSDMPNYEDLPRPLKSPSNIGDGIAYVNDSIIV